MNWTSLTSGSCLERLDLARDVVGQIVSVCGGILPATEENAGNDGDVAEAQALGAMIAERWASSARCRAGLGARFSSRDVRTVAQARAHLRVGGIS